ncbi:MAG: GIN domain-containing protein, partial [Flavobacteriales bacterium]
TQLDVSLTGSGDVQAGAFAAERGSAELIGSGNAKVNFTTDQVSTTVVGSGVLKRVGGSDRKE